MADLNTVDITIGVADGKITCCPESIGSKTGDRIVWALTAPLTGLAITWDSGASMFEGNPTVSGNTVSVLRKGAPGVTSAKYSIAANDYPTLDPMIMNDDDG